MDLKVLSGSYEHLSSLEKILKSMTFQSIRNSWVRGPSETGTELPIDPRNPSTPVGGMSVEFSRGGIKHISVCG